VLDGSAGSYDDADAMRRVAVAFARSTATPERGLCSVCVEVVEVSGAGLTLMAGDQAGPLCVSSDVVRALEDQQFTSGEGPCRDAFEQRTPVLADRIGADSSRRWPFFTDLAVALGVKAVFAYPLTSNGAAVGVMTLYQNLEGALTDRQRDDAAAVAGVIADTLLSLQGDAADGSLPSGLAEAVAYRAQIHQATGMVAVQLGVGSADGLARIRAYAFANDLPIADVASEIVARRLRLSAETDDSGSTDEASGDRT